MRPALVLASLLSAAGVLPAAEVRISLESPGGLRLLEHASEKVEVITGKEAEKLPGASLDEKISALLPGANLSRPNGLYSYRSNLSLRGFSSAEQGRVLILLNGVPLNNSATGSVNWNMVSLEELEKIEIFKGAGSFVYGSNAVAGVINIVTVKPGRGTRVEQSYGSDGTFLSRLRTGFGGKKFAASAAAAFLDSDGYVSVPAASRTAYTVERYARERDLSLKTLWKTGNGSEMETQYVFYDGIRGEGSRIMTADGQSRKHSDDFLRNRWTFSGKDFSFENILYYDRQKYSRLNEYYRSSTYYRVDTEVLREDLSGSAFFSFRGPGGTGMLAGADYKKGLVDGSDAQSAPSSSAAYNKGKSAQRAVYLQAEKKYLAGRLGVTAGVRYDKAGFYDGYFYNESNPGWSAVNGDIAAREWDAFSSKALVSWKYSAKAEQHFSYGRGFRPSPLEDLCLSILKGGIVSVANPALKPEKVDSWETGFKTSFFGGFYFDPSFYANYGRDFIYEVNTGETVNINGVKPVYKKENVAKVLIYGFELPVKAFWKDLSLLASWAFSKSRIKSFPANRTLEDRELTYSPRNILSCLLSFGKGIFSADLGWKRKSAQFTNDANTQSIKPYSLLSAGIGVKAAEGLDVALKADNLEDKRYMESSSDAAPGRTLELSLKYSF